MQIEVHMIEVQMIEVQIEVQVIEVQIKPAWKEGLIPDRYASVERGPADHDGHCHLDFDEQQGAPLQAALEARLGDAVVGITHDRNESVEHDDRDEQHGDHQQVGQHVPNCETSPEHKEQAHSSAPGTWGNTRWGVWSKR